MPVVQLVILAAGHGRRFGGLKQLAPVGPNGESIMDYTALAASGAHLVGYRTLRQLMREPAPGGRPPSPRQ